MTLPRRQRLPRAAFPAALAAPKRAASEHFSLILGHSKDGGIAAVVSKKVAKRSVDRHLLKRRMLEALRPHSLSTCSLIAYARAGSLALSYKDLKKELETLLSRV